MSSALFYPALAVSAAYAFIFSSGDAASWPFDYRSIFLTAFVKTPAEADTQLCRNQGDLVAGIDTRIRGAVDLDDPQVQRLGTLERALGAAADSLAQTCPREIPAEPIARLELMESQITKMLAALDTIREPLRDFQNSLSDEQRARFAVMIAAGATKQGNTGCGSTAAAVDWSIDQIDRAVQPTDAQHDALDDVRQAFAAAARDIAAHCLASLPPTAPSRLVEIAGNLTVMQQAVASIRTALAGFETKLTDEQKVRFNALNFSR